MTLVTWKQVTTGPDFKQVIRITKKSFILERQEK